MRTEPERVTGIPADWDQPTEYERWYASSLGLSYRSSVERVLRPWLAQSEDKVLADLGCGPGLMIERLLPASTRVIGIDCSFKMARHALARTLKTGQSHQFVGASVTRLPVRSACFDFAVCLNCLEFVDDRRLAFAEIARVVRPGGHVVIGVLNKRSAWEATRRLWRPFSNKPYYRGRFFSAHELRQKLGSAGVLVEQLEMAVCFPPVPPGWLHGLYGRLDELRLISGGVILCRGRRL